MVLTKLRHIYQKKKIQKCIFALESAFQKIGCPPLSQKLNLKKIASFYKHSVVKT